MPDQSVSAGVGPRVERGDRGLRLIGARAAVAHGLVDERQTFGDQVRFHSLRF